MAPVMHAYHSLSTYALKMLGYNDISDLHTPCVLFFKQDKKMVSLCVYKVSDWLQLSASASTRFGSIKTLVMFLLLLLLVFLYQVVIM